MSFYWENHWVTDLKRKSRGQITLHTQKLFIKIPPEFVASESFVSTASPSPQVPYNPWRSVDLWLLGYEKDDSLIVLYDLEYKNKWCITLFIYVPSILESLVLTKVIVNGFTSRFQRKIHVVNRHDTWELPHDSSEENCREVKWTYLPQKVMGLQQLGPMIFTCIRQVQMTCLEQSRLALWELEVPLKVFLSVIDLVKNVRNR